jgi:hypothetical protein
MSVVVRGSGGKAFSSARGWSLLMDEEGGRQP